ncbi:hypothetical protein [Streptacidiphilus sp. MAP5-3]|uniref:hypothetical protein n=1 Tax=unclassified Streptacidiphilus TaxID=2643834 RepID=UPI0035182A2A
MDAASANARIADARCTCPDGAVRDEANRSSTPRSASVNSITNGLLAAIAPP